MQINDGESNRGSNCHGEFAKYCNKGKPKTKAELIAMRPKEPKPVENWEFDFDVVSGLQIGPDQDISNPDFYGDYEDNHNVPYIPGVSPMQGPNPCAGGSVAAAMCLINFATSFPWSTNQTSPNDNFFLAYHVNYSNHTGLTVSDMKYKNLYGGQAALAYIMVNNHLERQGTSYMPIDGQYRPVSTSGGIYHSDGSISIDIKTLYLVNTSNGLGAIPQTANFVIPSFDDFKSFMGIK